MVALRCSCRAERWTWALVLTRLKWDFPLLCWTTRSFSSLFFFFPFLYIFLFIKEYFWWDRQKQSFQPLQTPIIRTPLTSCPLISTVRACRQEDPDTLRLGPPYWRPTAAACRSDKRSQRFPYQFLQDLERSEPRRIFSLPPGPHAAVTSQEGAWPQREGHFGPAGSAEGAAAAAALPEREIAALLPAASEGSEERPQRSGAFISRLALPPDRKWNSAPVQTGRSRWFRFPLAARGGRGAEVGCCEVRRPFLLATKAIRKPNC